MDFQIRNSAKMTKLNFPESFGGTLANNWTLDGFDLFSNGWDPLIDQLHQGFDSLFL